MGMWEFAEIDMTSPPAPRQHTHGRGRKDGKGKQSRAGKCAMRGVQKGPRNTAYQRLGSNWCGWCGCKYHRPLTAWSWLSALFKGLKESSASSVASQLQNCLCLWAWGGSRGQEGTMLRSRDTTARRSLIASPAAGGPVIPRLSA